MSVEITGNLLVFAETMEHLGNVSLFCFTIVNRFLDAVVNHPKLSCVSTDVQATTSSMPRITAAIDSLMPNVFKML